MSFMPSTSWVSQHLLISCDFIVKVWNACYSWTSPNFAYAAPNFVVGHFWLNSYLGRSDKERHIWKVMWCAIIFHIWKERNNCIFSQQFMDWKLLVQDIMFLVWFWALYHLCLNSHTCSGVVIFKHACFRARERIMDWISWMYRIGII